ncbi:MAG: VWA domain-containing protein [Candidatus Methanoperedenaceae archaeon]|nr:VWA domain-containing protein [Candidatus Methanoperedenaceae archaeon]
MADGMSILDTLLPNKEHQVVCSDSMDTMMFTDLRKQSEKLQEVEKGGTEALKTFPPLAQDIWSSLFKFSPEFRKPEELAPSHRFNSTLLEKMVQMQEYRELRVHTRLDEMHSAMATVAMAEEMARTLKDELKDQAELANAADSIQQELQRAINAAQTYQDMTDMSGNPEFQKKADENVKKAEQCKSQLQQAEAKLEQSCEAGANKIRGNVRAAASSALKNSKEVSEAMDGWGLGVGELQKMPIEQKLELAKRLQTRKFKLMAQVIGRMRRLAVHKQKTRLNQSRDEIHNVGIGNDLSRVLPIELAQLRHPVARAEFKRKFVEGKLMQYELKGTEKQGKGPIVVCVDNSGSMSGDRETWSKAVALALLEIATMQKRGFACIHFGGPLDALEIIEIKPGEKDILSKAVKVAAFFLNAGGTAFEPALSQALELISKQSFKKADVVFITDGNAPIGPKFLSGFLYSKKSKEFRVFGVLIQSHNTETLKKFSDEIVRVDELLDAEAEGLMDI